MTPKEARIAWQARLRAALEGRDTPSNEVLLRLAEKHPAPQEWYDEDFSGCLRRRRTPAELDAMIELTRRG